MDVERRTAAWVAEETAFQFFADPANLPAWVPLVTFEEAVAVDGDPGAEPDPDLGAAVPPARFLPDRAGRRVDWTLPGDRLSGSVELRQATPNSTDVLLRLHAADDVDPERLRELLEQAVRSIGRRLSGR